MLNYNIGDFMSKNFEYLEKIILIVLLICTIIAIMQEINVMIVERNITLADILLLFIYLEVLGMVTSYWGAQKIRLTYPLFIAITAIARLIILQSISGLIFIFFVSNKSLLKSLTIQTSNNPPKIFT